jgi:hypothetical protein
LAIFGAVDGGGALFACHQLAFAFIAVITDSRDVFGAHAELLCLVGYCDGQQHSAAVKKKDAGILPIERLPVFFVGVLVAIH